MVREARSSRPTLWTPDPVFWRRVTRLGPEVTLLALPEQHAAIVKIAPEPGMELPKLRQEPVYGRKTFAAERACALLGAEQESPDFFRVGAISTPELFG